jgi:hypothetical protein
MSPVNDLDADRSDTRDQPRSVTVDLQDVTLSDRNHLIVFVASGTHAPTKVVHTESLIAIQTGRLPAGTGFRRSVEGRVT